METYASLPTVVLACAAAAASGQAPTVAVSAWALGPFVRTATPVLSPTPESVFDCPIERRPVRWEQQNVYNPAVVVREGKVYLLYRGDDGPKQTAWGRTCRIGLATSRDPGGGTEAEARAR